MRTDGGSPSTPSGIHRGRGLQYIISGGRAGWGCGQSLSLPGPWAATRRHRIDPLHPLQLRSRDSRLWTSLGPVQTQLAGLLLGHSPPHPQRPRLIYLGPGAAFSRGNMWSLPKKKKKIISSLQQLILASSDLQQLGLAVRPRVPTLVFCFLFFSLLVFVMRDSEGFLQPDWVSLSSYQSGIVINGPHICNGTVIHVHNNSLEVAWVPTGTDQGKIKPCLVHRRLSELVPAASRHPGKTIGTGTQTEAGGQVRRQREAPGEHEPGPSWSQPCLFCLFPFLLFSPHTHTPPGEDGM